MEYVGEEAEDGDAVAAENGESDKTTEAAYTISYKGTKLQPADLEEESCPVEMSVDQKKSGKDILKQLRAIRDDQLNQTALGKQMSGLYYKAAPFIVAKLALNKETRNAVYQDLVTLQPMFKDVSENGADSSYTITENDQKAITRLYETAIKSVPSFLKKT